MIFLKSLNTIKSLRKLAFYLFLAIAIAMGMLFFAVIIVVWNLVAIGWNDHSSGCYNIYESPVTSTSTENLLFVDIHNVSCLRLNFDIIKAVLNITKDIPVF